MLLKKYLALLFVCKVFICYLNFYQRQQDGGVHWFYFRLEQNRIQSKLRWRM